MLAKVPFTIVNGFSRPYLDITIISPDTGSAIRTRGLIDTGGR